VGYRLPKRYGILSLEVRNLFDNPFKFQDIPGRTASLEPQPPPFLPERTIFAKLILAF
jgi:hypothetical protein